MSEYTIVLTWDDEAQVWVAINDEIPIALNSASLDELMDRVKLAVPEMLEMNGKPHEGIPLHFKADRVVVAA
jgi:predicted RNase H-like HicB family nuclease